MQMLLIFQVIVTGVTIHTVFIALAGLWIWYNSVIINSIPMIPAESCLPKHTAYRDIGKSDALQSSLPFQTTVRGRLSAALNDQWPWDSTGISSLSPYLVRQIIIVFKLDPLNTCG